MTDKAPTLWPRALVRMAWAGVALDDDPTWWPCLDPKHVYAGHWVPMLGEVRDYDRVPEPLTDEDQDVIMEVIRQAHIGSPDSEVDQ